MATLLALLGQFAKYFLLLILFYTLLYGGAAFFTVLLRRFCNARILRSVKGKWAIVTGATDGVGRGIAREFANKGINLILISRTTQRLEDLQIELSKLVSVEILQIDFTTDVDFRSVLANVHNKKEVHVLVNNVGVNADRPTLYTEHADKMEDDIIKVNVINTLKLTREFLSWDPSPAQKKYVLNVGSMLGSIPSPYQQIYSGTKAFLLYWTLGVAAEMRRTYHFELLMTGLVCTKLSGAKRPGPFVPTADYYGKCCVNSFGFTHITYPYLAHWLLGFLSSLVTNQILSAIIMRVGSRVRRRIQNRTQKKGMFEESHRIKQ